MKDSFSLFVSIFSEHRRLELGWILTPLALFINDFVFSDWHFFVNLMIIVLVDTVLGVICSWRAKNISSEAFSRIFNKIFIYSMVLVATHTACHMRINGEVNFLLSWIDSFIYSTIVVRELLSIFEKTTMLGYFKPPKWILAKLKHFDNTGEILKKDDNDNR